MIEPVKKEKVEGHYLARIMVAGVGNYGVNVINWLVDSKVGGVEFVAMDTDGQKLRESRAHAVVHLTQGGKGLGAGGNPAAGRAAAEHHRVEMEKLFAGADLVVVVASLGGGTGTGATPVVADVAKSRKALVVAVVLLPHSWDGEARLQQANEELAEITNVVDSYCIVPNDAVLDMVTEDTPDEEADRLIDGVVLDSVSGMVEMISRPGHINVDLNDVRSALENAGLCIITTGRGEGQDRVQKAVTQAIQNPLLKETPLNGAKHLLVNIYKHRKDPYLDRKKVMDMLREHVPPSTTAKVGIVYDDSLADKIRVTIIASGLEMAETVEDADISEVDEQFEQLAGEVAPFGMEPRRNARMERRAEHPGSGRSFQEFDGADGESEIINRVEMGFQYGDEDSELSPLPTFTRFD